MEPGVMDLEVPIAQRARGQPPPPLPEPRDGRPWPLQGDWTYDDYLRLPDDGRRYEIIEGVLYVTSAPDYAHQYAVQQIVYELMTYVRAHKSGVVLAAPFEVHLPGIATPVQPDVLFIPTEKQPASGAKFFEGVPALIVEVLSPSTARTDRLVKLDAYERAGVREYWLVDPKLRFVEVYVLTDGRLLLREEYGIGEKVISDVLPGLEIEVDRLFAP